MMWKAKNCQQTCDTKLVQTFQGKGHQPQNKTRSGRSSVMEDEASFEMAEQQSSTSTCTLSTELYKAPSINTFISLAL